MAEKIKVYLKEYFFIALGTLIFAIALNVFLTPNKLSAGGVSSLGTILLYCFKIKLSVTNVVANAILFILGYNLLGKGAVFKSAAGIVFLSVFLELTEFIPVYTDDMLLAAAAGGILMGFGIGLVVRHGASTGGSDFAALIIKRLVPHVPIAVLILIIDCMVVLIAGIVFKSVTITLYSIALLYLSSKATDAVVTLGDAAKSVQIFSDKSEEVANAVMERFERGVSGIRCKGMYSRSDRLMLLCVVSPKELPILINLARRIDKSAFIVINDSKEVLGEGFKSGSSYDALN